MKEVKEMLPTAASVARADVGPTDIVVVTVPEILSSEQARYLKTALADVWPDNKVVVLDRGITIKIARAADHPQLSIGDHMRLSGALIKDIADQPNGESPIVRVVDVKVEDDDCEVLVVEQVEASPR